jgi:Lytic transglycolase
MGSKTLLAATAALAMALTVTPAQAATTHHHAKKQSGDMTYYNLGITSCGVAYSDSDLVAAIAYSYWTTPNPNVDPMCHKSARITDPQTGKSLVVMIKDKCSGCNQGDIDVSPAAFQRFRDLGAGRIHVTWNFT